MESTLDESFWENLFGEDEGDEPESEPEEEWEQEEADEAFESPEGETAPERNLFTVKYNGEERQITREEAVALAQKGMDYDKILSERDSLRNDPVMPVLKSMAHKANTTPEALANTLSRLSEMAEMQAIERSGVPGAFAKSFMALREQFGNMNRPHESFQRGTAENQVWQSLHEVYPDAKVEKLSPETLAAIRSGKHPADAYAHQLAKERENEVRELKTQLEKREKWSKSAAKSAGSATGDGAGDTMDAFLAGFLKG